MFGIKPAEIIANMMDNLQARREERYEEDIEEDDDEEESLPLFVKIIFCIIAFVAALGISAIIMQALFSDSIVKPHSVALATAISYGVYSFLRKLYFTFRG